MSGELPQRVEPLRLAEQRRTLGGTMPLSRMSRLAPLLRSETGSVAVHVQFGVDDQGVAFLQGHIAGALEVTCQRCLGPMTLPMDIDFTLGLVRSEAEGERLPASYDPLIVEADPMSLSDIIEDELILALPIIARHTDREGCVDIGPPGTPEGQGADGQAGRPNPFAVLGRLKKR